MYVQTTFFLKIFCFALILVPLSSHLVFSSDAKSPVKVCRSSAEFAPYVYRQRIAGSIDRTEITGATTEFLEKIFQYMELEYAQEMLPWKRCLEEVENFNTRGQFEMFTDGSYSKRRAHKFFVTTPIYRMTEGLWYSRKRFPEGMPITDPVSLNDYRLCGVLGNNLSWLKEFGVKTRVLEIAKTLDQLMQIVSAGRCDFFFYSLEPTYGGKEIGIYNIPEDIIGIPFPGERTVTMHMFVSKTSPRAEELYSKLNQAILALQYDGTAEKIYRKYLVTGTGYSGK